MITEITHAPLGHNIFYIATGLLIALVGSWLSVNVHVKAYGTSGDRKALMLILAGLCLGCTAWTSHYVWMLGVSFPFLHSYELDGVILSLLVAVSTSCLGLYIASARAWIMLRLIGGLVIGAGVGVMHFLGMVSLNFSGTRVFDLWLVAAAFGAGTVLTAAAMTSSALVRTTHPKLVASTLLGASILVLHYVGMASIRLQFDLATQTESAINDRDLVFSVIFVAFSIMGMASVAFAVDTRNSGQKLRDMEHRAFHDNLTGLPNRAMLEDTLGLITQLVTPGKSLVVVNFDLNRFKDINDVHGHAAGDQVLVTIAGRLKEALRGGEFLCRVGGDEFVAFKREVTGKREAEEFAIRLRSAITPDIEWNDKRLNVGSSLGLAMYPDNGRDIRELLVKADLAMYRAKRDRSGIPVFYSRELDDENMDKSALSIDLREALAQEQLMLVYQRQNAIEDGALVGYEVLTRWNHPRKGPVGPDVFIPLAERDGVINEIGEWVLMKACQEAASWSSPTRIAVNVAARQIAHDGFPEIVRKALDRSGLDPSLLEIEITESGIIADAVQALKIVREIKAMGVAIVMDDFGTGYSSLSTLQSFPFDKIKIDKGFIKDVSVSRQSQAIVKSTIVLANALEIAVLAEGVETEADLEFLRREGCRQVQGFLFGQPLTAAEVASAA